MCAWCQSLLTLMQTSSNLPLQYLERPLQYNGTSEEVLRYVPPTTQTLHFSFSPIGFTLSTYEIKETIVSLWTEVKEFMKQYPQHVSEDNAMRFLSNTQGRTYNRCHCTFSLPSYPFISMPNYTTLVWSNFEVADLDFWRSEAYTDFFNFLDRAGGIYYEVNHFLSVTLLFVLIPTFPSVGEMLLFTVSQQVFCCRVQKSTSSMILDTSTMIGRIALQRKSSISRASVNVKLREASVSVCIIACVLLVDSRAQIIQWEAA